MIQYFNDAMDFKTYVGGAVNTDFSMESIRPTIQTTMQSHILPIIGQQMVDSIHASISGTGVPLGTGNEWPDLMPYILRPLGLLSLYEYLDIGSVMMGEGGLFRVESQEQKTAYKYQTNNYQRTLLTHGYNAIEDLIVYLRGKDTTYPLYASADESKYNWSMTINLSRDWRRIYNRQMDRYTFEAIRPILQDIEQLSLVPNISPGLYAQIIEQIQMDNISATNQALLPFIQKAVAAYTTLEATERHLIQIKGNRIIIVEELEPQSSRKTTNPSGRELSVAHTHHQELAERYMAGLVQYLDAHENDYPLYQAWVQERAAPAVAANNCNSTTHGAASSKKSGFFRM